MEIKWISVNEKLPETDGFYLVATSMSGKNEGVTMLSFRTVTVRGKETRRWQFWGGKIFDLDVFYWAELPKPPKGISNKVN